MMDELRETVTNKIERLNSLPIEKHFTACKCSIFPESNVQHQAKLLERHAKFKVQDWSQLKYRVGTSNSAVSSFSMSNQTLQQELNIL